MGFFLSFSASLVGLYILYLAAIFASLNPTIVRFVLYAKRWRPRPMRDVTKPENFGFMRGQAVPFTVDTPDGETLFAWHVLPLALYEAHEVALSEEARLGTTPYKHSLAYRLLVNDPKSRLIINFHGTGGNLASSFRPAGYRAISMSSDAHFIAFDYRGFGRSTGSPNEEGIIVDGVAMVNFALNHMSLPPDRIVLLSQSLGTGILSATALHFADPDAAERLLPSRTIDAASKYETVHPVRDFASVILVAPFLSISRLSDSRPFESALGMPLRLIPGLKRLVHRLIPDPWDSQSRIAALVRARPPPPAPPRDLRLHIMHALDDEEVAVSHAEELLYTAAQASQPEKSLSPEAFKVRCGGKEVGHIGTRTWRWGDRSANSANEGGRGQIVLEIFGSGGHNELLSYVNTPVVLRRAFLYG